MMIEMMVSLKRANHRQFTKKNNGEELMKLALLFAVALAAPATTSSTFSSSSTASLLALYHAHPSIYEPIQEELLHAQWFDKILAERHHYQLALQRDRAAHFRQQRRHRVPSGQQQQQRATPITVGILQSSLVKRLRLLEPEWVRKCRVPCRVLDVEATGRPLRSFLPISDNRPADVPEVMLSAGWLHRPYWDLHMQMDRLRENHTAPHFYLKQMLAVLDVSTTPNDLLAVEASVENGPWAQTMHEFARTIDLWVSPSYWADVRVDQASSSSKTQQQSTPFSSLSWDRWLLLPQWKVTRSTSAADDGDADTTMTTEISFNEGDARSQCASKDPAKITAYSDDRNQQDSNHHGHPPPEPLWFQPAIKHLSTLVGVDNRDALCRAADDSSKFKHPSLLIPKDLQRASLFIHVEPIIARFRAAPRLRQFSQFPQALVAYFGHPTALSMSSLAGPNFCQPLAMKDASPTTEYITLRIKAPRHFTALRDAHVQTSSEYLDVTIPRCRAIPALSLPSIEALVDLVDVIRQSKPLYMYLLGGGQPMNVGYQERGFSVVRRAATLGEMVDDGKGGQCPPSEADSSLNNSDSLNTREPELEWIANRHGSLSVNARRDHPGTDSSWVCRVCEHYHLYHDFVVSGGDAK